MEHKEGFELIRKKVIEFAKTQPKGENEHSSYNESKRLLRKMEHNYSIGLDPREYDTIIKEICDIIGY